MKEGFTLRKIFAILGILIYLFPVTLECKGNDKSSINIETFIHILEDNTKRSLLIQDLKKHVNQNSPTHNSSSSKSQGNSGKSLPTAAQTNNQVNNEYIESINTLVDPLNNLFSPLIKDLSKVPQRIKDFHKIDEVIFKVFGIIAIGILVYFLLPFIIRTTDEIEIQTHSQFAHRFMTLLVMLVKGILPLAIFIGGSLFIIYITENTSFQEKIMLQTTFSILLFLSFRLFNLSVAHTKFISFLPLEGSLILLRVISRLAFTFVVMYMISLFAMVFNFKPKSISLIHEINALSLALVSLQAIVYYRTDVRDWIKSLEDPKKIGAKAIFHLADIWHIILSSLIISGYVAWIYGGSANAVFTLKGAIITSIILIGIRYLISLINNFWHKLAKLQKGRNHPPHKKIIYQRMNVYVPYLDKAFKGLLSIFATVIIGETWNLNLYNLTKYVSSAAIITAVLKISLTVSIFIFIAECWNILISYNLTPHQRDGVLYTPSARMKTLLPIAQKVGVIILSIIGFLTTLSLLGFDITPILASFSVLFLGLGVGLQSVVRDFVTGMFVLLENDVDVGDVVKVGECKGVVDSIQIRVMKIRDKTGAIHVVPFSELKILVNFSHDYTVSYIELPISHKEDIKKMREIVSKVISDMRKEDPFKDQITEDVDLGGIKVNKDGGICLKAKIKTVPDPYNSIESVARERIKEEFDKANIEWPDHWQKVIIKQEASLEKASSPKSK